MEEKLVTYKHLKIGQQIKGTEGGGWSRGFSAIVKSVNPSFVTVEMWNAWLYGTPYEIASYCVKNNMKVIGHSTDITPKLAMFSGDILDVGVCAEYEDGERCWCHYRSEDIKEMIESYKDLIV